MFNMRNMRFIKVYPYRSAYCVSMFDIDRNSNSGKELEKKLVSDAGQIDNHVVYEYCDWVNETRKLYFCVSDDRITISPDIVIRNW